MVKIGGVSIDVSHPKSFSLAIENNNFDMKYTHIVKESFRTDEELDWFSKRFNVVKEESISEMANKVDIGFIQACNWDKHLKLAKPFLDKDKPVFIDKPIVGNVKDANEVRRLIKEGKKIYGASSVRFSQELIDFVQKPVEEKGEILSVYSVTAMNEYDYAIHIVEAMSEIVKSKAVSNTFIGSTENGENQRLEHFQITYENGVKGIYSTRLFGGIPFSMTVITTKGVYTFGPNTMFYENLLKEIYSQVTTGESNLADMETILNCCEIMICGKKSRDDENGKTVYIGDLKETDGFDGFAFEDKYSKNANRNLYKD